MKNKIQIICLILYCFQVNAQSSAESKLGTWYMYNGSHKLTKNIKLTTSAHFRYYELATEYQQEIYRIGLNYAFNDKINVTGGSVYSITDKSYKKDAADLYEYRFYQDLNIKDNWNKIRVKHRVRLAQRFKRRNATNEIAHRIRYGLFLNYPISKNWETYTFSELFIKFATKAYSQNRTGAGILKKIDDNLKLKLGYFYTKFSNSDLHRLQVGIILKTDFTKKTI
ncbi:DUF2490 domain-containing protein [Polaribacter sp. HaHaR_3_91]|jgi:hypothetical protein|uniref:DUF2490 domain-containing protein n=1 Tax=Polaribacter sp. HaHaR_3_91 TaxID=2745561 RepID=UPI001C4E4600|nr:DUF2490 domain-containing protein [Polaribacter sp. HaHaR_3_91]QXP62826.1 DUF2490 domain-containing protein [Polaribacter sp. HaHaR_3_91]